MTREQPLGFRVEYTYDDDDRVTKKFSYDRTSLVTVTRYDYKYDNVGHVVPVADYTQLFGQSTGDVVPDALDEAVMCPRSPPPNHAQHSPGSGD